MAKRLSNADSLIRGISIHENYFVGFTSIRNIHNNHIAINNPGRSDGIVLILINGTINGIENNDISIEGKMRASEGIVVLLQGNASVSNISSNTLKVHSSSKIGVYNSGIHIDAQTGLVISTRSITDINNNTIDITDAGEGINIGASFSGASLLIDGISHNTITFKGTELGTFIPTASGIYVHGSSNLGFGAIRVKVYNITDNTINMETVDDSGEATLFGIAIVKEDPSSLTDNYQWDIKNIENNHITLKSKQGDNKGITLWSTGASTLSNLSHNNIHVSSDGLNVGIRLHELGSFGKFDATQIIGNQITLTGLESEYLPRNIGIQIDHNSPQISTFKGINNNSITLQGTMVAGSGIYLEASEGTSWPNSGLRIQGMQNNRITLEGQANGIYATTLDSNSSIFITADPLNSSIGPSAANYGTSYEGSEIGPIEPPPG